MSQPQYPDRCSCGVPHPLHATACGWQNARTPLLPGETSLVYPMSTDELMRRAAATGYLDPADAPPADPNAVKLTFNPLTLQCSITANLPTPPTT